MQNLDVWNNFFEQWPRAPKNLPQRIPFDTDRFEAFSTGFRDNYWTYNHRDDIDPEELVVTVGEFVGKSAHVMYKLAKSIDKSFSDADDNIDASVSK
jgi:hypothetical protein